MRWGDLDRTAKVLQVQRTYWKGQDLVLKTKGSRRSVDLGDQLLAALGALARERFPDGAIDLEAPVFVTPDGGRIDLDHFRKRVWSPALAKAGLPYRRPYALRHTFATLLLSEGQSVKYVSSQLGHASAVMTLNTYARWLPRERREAPARLEAALAAARVPVVPVLTDANETSQTGYWKVSSTSTWSRSVSRWGRRMAGAACGASSRRLVGP